MTDFGNDPYIGIMKGRILQINPSARILSLTNHIKNHDIRQGAFIILKSYRYFPHSTIFVIVVDPGVGGARKAIAAKKDDYYFIGPDNGILSPILDSDDNVTIVSLPISEDDSFTFHGRDVFAPAAGILSQSYSLEELGPPSTIQSPFSFYWDSSSATGEVIFIDQFGNIITNIPYSQNLIYGREYQLLTTRTRLKLSFKRTYSEGSNFDPFLVANSFETLEIALRNGRAADIVDITAGDRIQILPVET